MWWICAAANAVVLGLFLLAAITWITRITSSRCQQLAAHLAFLALAATATSRRVPRSSAREVRRSLSPIRTESSTRLPSPVRHPSRVRHPSTTRHPSPTRHPSQVRAASPDVPHLPAQPHEPVGAPLEVALLSQTVIPPADIPVPPARPLSPVPLPPPRRPPSPIRSQQEIRPTLPVTTYPSRPLSVNILKYPTRSVPPVKPPTHVRPLQPAEIPPIERAPSPVRPIQQVISPPPPRRPSRPVQQAVPPAFVRLPSPERPLPAERPPSPVRPTWPLFASPRSRPRSPGRPLEPAILPPLERPPAPVRQAVAAMSSLVPGVIPPERLPPPRVPSPRSILAGQPRVVEVLSEGMEHFVTTTEMVTVYRAPMDGDSLFLALAHQIFQVPHGSLQHRAYADYIRMRTSSELTTRLGEYRELLLESVAVHRERYAGLLSEEAKMRHYLRDLATPAFPGGREVVKLMSQLAEVHVAIFPEGGHKEVIRLWQEAPTIGIGRQLLLRSDGTVHHHYSSVFSVMPLQA